MHSLSFSPTYSRECKRGAATFAPVSGLELLARGAFSSVKELRVHDRMFFRLPGKVFANAYESFQKYSSGVGNGL